MAGPDARSLADSAAKAAGQGNRRQTVLPEHTVRPEPTLCLPPGPGHQSPAFCLLAIRLQKHLFQSLLLLRLNEFEAPLRFFN